VLAASATAEQIILGSYMTAAATANHIRRRAVPDAVVTIVAMGFEGIATSVQDERCADYLEHLLTGTPYDHVAALWDCLHDPSIEQSLRGEHDYRPKEDIILSLQRDLFDFAMVGMLDNGQLRVTRVGA
jgi:phosphosulfolactate phosphohydrolase-like enzyme